MLPSQQPRKRLGEVDRASRSCGSRLPRLGSAPAAGQICDAAASCCCGGRQASSAREAAARAASAPTFATCATGITSNHHVMDVAGTAYSCQLHHVGMRTAHTTCFAPATSSICWQKVNPKVLSR